jgi:hypothetical protein
MADTKVSALTAVATPAGTDEIPVNQAGTSKKLTLAQAKTFVTDAPTFAAGSATAGTKPKLSTGTLLTAAEAGAIEYTNPVLYFTPDADGGRAVVQASHLCYVNSDVTGSNVNTAQPIFAAANDRLTLKASTTYLFELFLDVTNGNTTCTKALSFDGGTCTFSAFRYRAIGQTVAINTTGTAQSSAHVDRATNTVILATGTAAWYIKAEGSFTVNASGTFLPQFTYSANPTGTVLIKRGTYLKLTPIGGTGDIAIGSWA